MHHTIDDDFDEDAPKSKTQIKKEMLALQALGIELAKLSADQRAKIPLDAKVREAIEETPKITSNSAKKRHNQFVGKLLRSSDIESIENAFNEIKEQSHRSVRQHHLIEHWRDALLENPDSLEEFFKQFPSSDRQQLRQLLRNIARQKQDVSGSRKLFRFIRDTVEEHRE